MEEKICLNCAGIVSLNKLIEFIWGLLQYYVEKDKIRTAYGEDAAVFYTNQVNSRTRAGQVETVINLIKSNFKKKQSKAGVKTLRHLKKVGLAPDIDDD